MPTLPITAMFVLQNPQLSPYIIFQYADNSRTQPEELTEEKIQELLSSFVSDEALTFGLALARPNTWVEVK